jgi:hypothetical protein
MNSMLHVEVEAQKTGDKGKRKKEQESKRFQY